MASNTSITVCAKCEVGFGALGLIALGLIAVCISCNNIFHAPKSKNCANVSASEIKVLELKKKTQMVYRCEECASINYSESEDQTLKQIVIEMKKSLDKMNESIGSFKNFQTTELPLIKSDIDELKNKFDNIEKKVISIEQANLNCTSESSNSENLSTISNNSKKSTSSQINTSSIQEAIYEIEERRKRENNLIIYNFDEYEENKDDTFFSDISTLLDDFTLESVIDKTNIKRIGTYENGKTRPVLIKMCKRSDVVEVVSNWKKLPEKIKCSFDHTPRQRQEYRKLRSQADSYNKAHPNVNTKKIVLFKKGNPQIIIVQKHSDNNVTPKLTKQKSVSFTKKTKNLSQDQ